MSVAISGILLDPYGNPAPFAEVKFITWQGANDVLTTSSAVYKTSSDGAYSLAVENGTFTVQVRYNQSNGKFQTIKQKVIVNSNTNASTLGELLLFNEPLTPPEIAYVEQLVAEAEGYRDEAEGFAQSSEASSQSSEGFSQASSGYADDANQSAIDAANSAALIAPVPLNGGVWASGQTYTAYNEYMIYNGEAYSPRQETVLPYIVGATPDLSFVYQIKLNSLQALSGLTEPSDLDQTHRTDATLTKLAAGEYSAGSKLVFEELGGAKFNVVIGGTPNGYDVRDAGNGNTAVLVIEKSMPLTYFGVTYSGDESGALNAAISYSDAKGVKIVGEQGKTVSVSAGFTVTVGAHLVGYGCKIKLTTNTIAGTLATVENGGRFWGFELDLSSFSAGAALQLVVAPLVGRIIFSQAYDWARDITLTGNSSAPSGDAVLVHAVANGVSDGSIQLANCAGLKANYFENGIHTIAEDSSWANSNVFKSCEMSRCNNPIFEESINGGTIAANEYPNFIFQHAAGNYGLILHSRARVSGLVWDGGTIQFNSDENVLDLMSSSQFSIVDNGKHNKINGHKYQYEDGRSTYRGDNRPWLGGVQGKIEFVDEFQGTDFGHPWNLGGVGAKTLLPVNDIRGGVNPFLEAGIRVTTDGSGTGSAVLDFGGNGGYVAELDPELAFTGRWTSTADSSMFSGFYKDPDNFIGVAADSFGSNIYLVCRSAGVETRQTLLLTQDNLTPLIINWPNLYFFTLRVSADKVSVACGMQSQTSTNLYQCLFLQEKLGDAYAAEVTTNIPTSVFLEPRFSISEKTANSVNMVMTNVQIKSKAGY